MGVASQNPALVETPDRFIGRIRIMAEDDGRGIVTLLLEHLSRIEARAPQVIDSYKLYAANDSCLVAEQGYSRRAHDLRHTLRNIQHPPVETIVMVTENAHSSKTAVWCVGYNALKLIELVWPSICNPVARENNEVRAELFDFAE